MNIKTYFDFGDYIEYIHDSEMFILRTHGFTTGLVAIESGMSVSPRARPVISGDKLTGDDENDKDYCKELFEAPRT